MTKLSGSCLCEAVKFEVPTPRNFEVCHFGDCRRWHGAPAMGIDATQVTLIGDASTLTWFASSEYAERGFCGRCGSSLFYRLLHNRARCSAYMGAFRNIPDSIGLGAQHFISLKPDFYKVVMGR